METKLTLSLGVATVLLAITTKGLAQYYHVVPKYKVTVPVVQTVPAVQAVPAVQTVQAIPAVPYTLNTFQIGFQIRRPPPPPERWVCRNTKTYQIIYLAAGDIQLDTHPQPHLSHLQQHPNYPQTQPNDLQSQSNYPQTQPNDLQSQSNYPQTQQSSPQMVSNSPNYQVIPEEPQAPPNTNGEGLIDVRMGA